MIFFVLIALMVWSGMHAYVFWRLSSLPFVSGLLPTWSFWLLALLLWAGFPTLVLLQRTKNTALLDLVAAISMTWLGCLFLIFACLALSDLLTLGGLVFAEHAPWIRFSAVAVGLALSAVAFVQGHREPVVTTQELVLPKLPKERDGMKLLLLSDLHLGSHLGKDWLAPLVSRSLALKPDIIVVAGDLVDNDAQRVIPLISELSRLQAPLGVWSVQGNHDVFGGPELSARIMNEAGFKMLRDSSALAAPGLRIVGVDDLGLRSRSGAAEGALERAFHDLARDREACIFLSHTPEKPEKAATLGAGLMLSGHTHGGQIWPFNYLVATRFKTIAGACRFGDMTLFVGRGAGTWGPRMRLWKPGEIVLITLRSSESSS